MKRFILVVITGLMLCACSSQPSKNINQPIQQTPSQTILAPTQKPTSTATPTTTPTLTPSPTTTLSSTPTNTASPTPTAIGGGNGIVMLQTCARKEHCEMWEFTLSTLELMISDQSWYGRELIRPEPVKYRYVQFDPTLGETKIVLECLDDIAVCSQWEIYSSLKDGIAYIYQGYQRVQYDSKKKTDIYRLNTQTGEISLIDHFEGSVYRFYADNNRPEGLLSTMSFPGRGILGELFLYNLESLERRSIIQRRGQIFHFGTTPDPELFWYRVMDHCVTELVSGGGEGVSQLKDSDGIVGWVDDETFLLFTTQNNPPFCTHSGIALANQYGLTGEWIATERIDHAQFTPDAEKLLLSSDCNNNGCKNLKIANLDGTDKLSVLEIPDRVSRFDIVFSTDERKMLISAGKQLFLADVDGANLELLLEFDSDWKIVGWLDG